MKKTGFLKSKAERQRYESIFKSSWTKGDYSWRKPKNGCADSEDRAVGNDYPREKRGEDREKEQEAVLVGKPWGEPRDGEGHDQSILYRNLKYEN